MSDASADRTPAEGLVEPQGVNAGSGAPEQAPADGDVQVGGRPEEPEQTSDTTQREAHVGPPDQTQPAPGQELAVGEG